MKRSSWKLPYIHSALFKKKYLDNKNNLIVSRFRNSIIPPYFIGRRACIYNGAWLLTKNIEDNMIGRKIGEYSVTKRFDCQAQRKRKTKRKTKKN